MFVQVINSLQYYLSEIITSLSLYKNTIIIHFFFFSSIFFFFYKHKIYQYYKNFFKKNSEVKHLLIKKDKDNFNNNFIENNSPKFGIKSGEDTKNYYFTFKKDTVISPEEIEKSIEKIKKINSTLKEDYPPKKLLEIIKHKSKDSKDTMFTLSKKDTPIMIYQNIYNRGSLPLKDNLRHITELSNDGSIHENQKQQQRDIIDIRSFKKKTEVDLPKSSKSLPESEKNNSLADISAHYSSKNSSQVSISAIRFRDLELIMHNNFSALLSKICFYTHYMLRQTSKLKQHIDLFEKNTSSISYITFPELSNDYKFLNSIDLYLFLPFYIKEYEVILNFYNTYYVYALTTDFRYFITELYITASIIQLNNKVIIPEMYNYYINLLEQENNGIQLNSSFNSKQDLNFSTNSKNLQDYESVKNTLDRYLNDADIDEDLLEISNLLSET